MPTLYVENVPEELYEAIRSRSRKNRKSISAEVLALLAENVPTPAERARRRQVMARARKIRSQVPGSQRDFPSSEQMQREDRLR
jgi:plasmid stability protein